MDNIVYTFKNDKSSYSHLYYEHPEKIGHYHHNSHNEILIFVRGNSKMAVEGTEYYLSPYDIMIMKSSEMHRMYHNDPITPYERYVWHIPDIFFIKNECEEFKKIFTARPLGEGNRIPGELVKDSYIPEILKKTDEYSTMSDVSESVLQSKLTELLFHLTQLHSRNLRESAADTNMRNIIMYINRHISEKLTLDTIAGNFFMSKSNLCRMFKEHTGLSVHQYIKQKRFIRIKELVAEGVSLTDASVKAGFGTYSSFYKMYLSETGRSPRDELK